MNVYLIIMVTALVCTEVIRIIQNHIHLFRQRKEINKTLGWIRDNDISETDFQTQREVFKKLNMALNKNEMLWKPRFEDWE